MDRTDSPTTCKGWAGENREESHDLVVNLENLEPCH
jgi:hypothetical protein